MAESPDRVQAAKRIQRVWRAKHLQATDFLTASVRLNDAKVHAELTAAREAAEAGHNTPRARWRRAIAFAGSLQDGNAMLTENGVQNRAPAKFLETQHWLELVDATAMGLTSRQAADGPRERISLNIFQWYHRRWQQADTTENFFKWLDKGEGKRLSLNECSREQLEKEASRRIYLSTEQRLNYLVETDDQGRLCWARNHELVDTTPMRWKDSDGHGIVQDEVSLRQALARAPSSDSISSRNSAAMNNAATHYTDTRKGRYRWTNELRKRFTLHGIVDRMLRKTVKRNTWIYVCDKSFNLFVGIKQTGTFQHSSLLSGGVVTSAGLISVKDGVIHTLSPLSGHYRTSIEHFHQFIDILGERGVDMSKAKISKAEVALWGIEHIKKFQKSQRRIVENGKQGVADTLHKVGEATNVASWKREVLEGRRRPPPAPKGIEQQSVAQ